MAAYKHFIADNIAPRGTRSIGVFRDGKKIGRIPLGGLRPPYSGKRLYSFGAISDPHVGQGGDLNCANVAAVLKGLHDDKDVKFIINGGDLFVWERSDKVKQERLLKRYAEIVAECCPTKPIFIAPGNHEQLSWYSYVDEKGEQKQDWHMARFLDEYAGWDRSSDGKAEVIKTVCFNEKGEVHPDGNDVLVLLACYQYHGGQEGHEYTCENLTVKNVGTEGGVSEKTTITVNDENFDWNKEWFGDRFETENMAGYYITITGVTEWDNGSGYYVEEANGNVLKIRGKLDESATIPADGVTFTSSLIPQSQIYLAQNSYPVEVSEDQLYGKLKDVFAQLKSEGKRIFVVQHVPVTSEYGEEERNPTYRSFLYRSLFYGTTVFSGHTHYEFAHPLGRNPWHSFNTSAGFRSIHIPSAYDHAQGYIVDVYENGIHLRGKKFKLIDGNVVSEDIPLGTYWIDTTIQEVSERYTYKEDA